MTQESRLKYKTTMKLRNLYPIRSILIFVFAPFITSLAFAAHHGNVDPTGSWEFLTTINGSTYEPTATISRDRDALKGTHTSGYSGEKLEMKDLTIESGNQFSFNASSGSFTLIYSGKIEGNQISGTMTAGNGGDEMSGTFTATRKVDALNPEDIAGTWSFSVLSDQGQNANPTLTISVGDGALTGIFKNRSEGREITPSELELNGNHLSLKLEGGWGFASYQGAIDRNKIAGTVEGEFQGTTVNGTFTGELEK